MLDTVFGASGKAEAPAGLGDASFATLSVLPNGAIVAAGSYQQTTALRKSWQVARFTASGELDSTFGNTGSTVFDLGFPYNPGGVESLAVTPAGYLISGRFFHFGSVPTDAVVARLLP